MTRTKLCDRVLPTYTVAEEVVNSATHAIGGVLSVVGLILCIVTAVSHGNAYGIIGSVIYGLSLIALYTVSSVYHGMTPCMGKKVMQVIDHCTIYFLIAGSYTVVALSALRAAFPAIGWGLFAFEWATAALAATLTAIDLKKYTVISMICYIGLGWAILPFLSQTRLVLGNSGFMLLFFGGVAYTIGAVLYGIGSKVRWMHSVFHVFVLLGSILQFFAVLLYAL